MTLRPCHWPLLALCAAACATPGGVLVRVDGLVSRGDYAQADALVEKEKASSYGDKNALLYDLDRAMLLQLAGKYEDSNRFFESAKAMARELYTKSVTNQAGTLLISDNIRPYAGEDFERAQIPLFSALNYVMLGKTEDALVETRQVDELLKKLWTDAASKNAYTEDAFARYLAGMIQEDAGETNDAFISYLQSLKAYDRYKADYGLEAPPELVQDALRTARALHFEDRVEDIKKKWGGEAPAPRPKGAGEVVVLHYQGLPPRKADSFFEISVAKGWVFVDAQKPATQDAAQVEQARTIVRSLAMDQMVRIAFPVFEPVPYGVHGLTVRAEGAETDHAASTAQDIGAIAVKNLKDRIGRERAKAIARAMIKWTLTQKAAAKVKEKNGEGAAWLVKAALQMASSLTETADKRSWGTLPDKINVARVTLPEGVHCLHLTFRSASGAPAGTQDLKDVAVRAGRRTFVIVRTAN
jgi:hypothetical protein